MVRYKKANRKAIISSREAEGDGRPSCPHATI